MKRKAEHKKPPPGYFRPRDVNPRWYEIWTDQVEEEFVTDPADILDQLCEITCGIQPGSADVVQAYARHIHACLEAAYQVGQAVAIGRPKDDS